jgi:hypothetical protein
MERARELVNTFEAEFENQSETFDESVDMQNRALIKSIQGKHQSKFTEIRRQIRILSDLFGAASLKDVNDEVAKWEKAKTEFEKKTSIG